MKTWKLLAAVALAVAAMLLVTSIVVAAPAATSSPPTNQVYDTTTEILTDTLPTTHPVGIIISVFFHIPYTQVMTLHDDGFGFGTIARAYLTAAFSNGQLTPEQVLALRQESVGWGQIKQQYDVSPGGKGLGSIMGKKPATPESPTAPEKVNLDKSGSDCPGNSCNASGQQKAPKGRPAEAPKN
jgi:hypothetical protein